jgi:hypothetical protein
VIYEAVVDGWWTAQKARLENPRNYLKTLVGDAGFEPATR